MVPAGRHETVLGWLLDLARADPAISAAAVTGSVARGAGDAWSDVDLFLGVAAGVPVEQVCDAWTSALYRNLGVLHHFELRAGSAVYRAFLLADLLEVDVGFTPAHEFGPLGPGDFQVVFGEAAARRPASPPVVDHLVGLGWHHVLHARSAIERNAPWHAEHWISAVRDQTLVLAALRLGLPTEYATGADRMPQTVTAPLRDALVRSLDREELFRALGAATGALLAELRISEPAAAAALAEALSRLADSRSWTHGRN